MSTRWPRGRWLARWFGGLAAFGLVLGAVLVWVIRQPTFGSLPAPPGPRASSAALKAHVQYLASTEPPRDWRHPEGLERAAGYIEQALAASGGRCARQSYRAGTITADNVIARFGPGDGAVVVVGAHYDVFGPLPGADDNASGVAGLLELGRLLGSTHLGAPVELVAYSTEEPPFFASAEMGSAVHATELVRSGVAVRAVIVLEMIGCFTSSGASSPSLIHMLYPRDPNFVAIVGRWPERDLARLVKRAFRGVTTVAAVSYTGPAIPGVDLSDHRSYWAAGYSALMVTDTAFLRNPLYHTAADTPESLDYGRMAGVVDGVLSAVVHLAGGSS